MDELSALGTLVGAADGRATVEPVTALLLTLVGPWAATRRAGPQADRDDRRVLEFLDAATLAGPLPTDHGVMSWMHHHLLGRPAAALSGPAWLADLPPGAWACLPPRTRHSVPLTGASLAVDGRLAMLALLVRQVLSTIQPELYRGQESPTEITAAVKVLTAWCVGPAAADLSLTSGHESPALHIHAHGFRQFWTSFRTVSADDMAALVMSDVLPDDSWRPPPPTPEERARAEQRARDLAEIARIRQSNDEYTRTHPARVQ